MPFPDAKPSLVYWELCGRADIAKLMFLAGEIDYDLDTTNANNWPGYKPECPFAQLPILHHGDVTLAQGGAINRYIARMGGLYPTDPVEASECDMVMDGIMDMFAFIFAPKKAEGKEAKLAAWAKFTGEDVPLYFGFLEKLLKGTFFGGDKANAADIAFYAIVGVMVHAECGIEEVLAKYPKLQAAYDGTKEVGKVSEFVRGGHYFSANPENDAF
mmetsp:Transcript_12285/g.14803  ORF Transcript_12285/g.14803 Transcript_12285/m.14803 type:complete len:215 (-) Transcript_12285:202-846(-)|eukprot:CAMPEP_0195263868 /NCGR_PEP_ID=MMETSP0706-20130129/10541_1 /TAXON_ID=33640 /ORGANISM="Asterionellopsis glacialis, Strain CCMP134" /LENGTH=214 /DNA_ID=CAMNT_0040318091 /DNA_START=111 /DNA_END=755 /DNA_ORIENTATION=+